MTTASGRELTVRCPFERLGKYETLKELPKWIHESKATTTLSYLLLSAHQYTTKFSSMPPFSRNSTRAIFPLLGVPKALPTHPPSPTPLSFLQQGQVRTSLRYRRGRGHQGSSLGSTLCHISGISCTVSSCVVSRMLGRTPMFPSA